jgi:multicomponent Na+:H+ antiporter subunit D
MFWSAHPEGDYAITGRVDGWTLAAPVVLTFIVILIGVQPAPFIEVSQAVAAQLLDPKGYVEAVLGVPE